MKELFTLGSNSKKLVKNLFLMFLVFFMPKIFSFLFVPLYTTYLTTQEYGISDLILNTASLIIPFVSLAAPNAIMRFTIENKNDKRPFQISIKIYIRGMIILLLGMLFVEIFLKINYSYLIFLYLIIGTSILSDINISYARGLERMNLVTICGVFSSLLCILCNVLFIVVFKLGLYGFLISTVVGYLFSILLVAFANRKKGLFIGFFDRETVFRKEMINFSYPLIFSGLSWWVISTSDRYFVSVMCGTSSNGIYSVAYKIPTILQAFDNVFFHAWQFTLYDSYKSEEGKKYISKVFMVYNFIFSFGCSLLIVFDIMLSHLLFSNDFFEAWKYVPLLLVSIVFCSASGLVSPFLSIYKKTKITMKISFISAFVNIVLNALFIYLLKNPMGAAIATVITFGISWLFTTVVASKLSGISFNIKKQLMVYIVLLVQAFIIIKVKSGLITSIGLLIIIFMNFKTIIWAKNKWRSFLKPDLEK